MNPTRPLPPLDPDATPEVSSRAKLLREATRLFAEKGLDATSVKDIAEAAGLNVSLISYYFGGKEALYSECIEDFGRWRLRTAQDLLAPAPTEEEFSLRLRLFMEDFLRVHCDEPHVTTILHRDMACNNPAIQDVFERTFLRSFEQLCSFLENGKSQGYLDENLDTILIASQVLGSMIHLCRHDEHNRRYFGNTIFDANYRKHFAESHVRTLLHGVSAKRKTKRGPS